jgi:hypothetical protein
MTRATEAHASTAEHNERKRVHSELEKPLFDLMLLLKAASHLREEDEDLQIAANLLVDLGAQKADELHDKYQRDWPTEGINSRIDGEGNALTAKAVILQQLAMCERQLKETRTKAEALSEEDA